MGYCAVRFVAYCTYPTNVIQVFRLYKKNCLLCATFTSEIVIFCLCLCNRNAACRKNTSKLWAVNYSHGSLLRSTVVSLARRLLGMHTSFITPCNDKQPCRLAKDGCFSMRVWGASFRTLFHCALSLLCNGGGLVFWHTCCNLCSDRTGDVARGRMLSQVHCYSLMKTNFCHP